MPLQLPEARALGCLLVEAQLEELVLERNHLCNAGLALICHAAQVPLTRRPNPTRAAHTHTQPVVVCEDHETVRPCGVQVHMSLLRLTVRGNVLDQPRAGHEAGDLLCNSGYLKVTAGQAPSRPPTMASAPTI